MEIKEALKLLSPLIQKMVGQYWCMVTLVHCVCSQPYWHISPYFECWNQAILGEIDGMDLILEFQSSELYICP